jgi:non-heme chloroperoxidase
MVQPISVKETPMDTIAVGQENSAPIELYYEDHGDGPPVVLLFAKSADNPWGVDEAGVVSVQQAILDDRAAWLTGLVNDFLNLEDNLGKRVSEETVRAIWNAGSEASPYATWACPPGWLEDFASDITRIDVPTLILHGTADRILPIEGQGRRLHAALPAARYVEIDGGPHVMAVTHAAEINRALVSFLSEQRGQQS